MPGHFSLVTRFYAVRVTRGSRCAPSLSTLLVFASVPHVTPPLRFFLASKNPIRFKIQIQIFRERPQLLGIQGASWLIIRKTQAMRETFQRGLLAGAGSGNGSVGGGGGDDDLGNDDDSPPSGPDAGGGATSSLFPPAEWQVMASSAHYTVSQVDFDRCGATSRFWGSCRLLSTQPCRPFTFVLAGMALHLRCR